MTIDKEKILIHADEILPSVGSRAEREEHVARFRRFLKVETERLKIRHRFGLDGREVARGRSYVIDLIVRRACQWALTQCASRREIEDRYAVIALGGYGRQEMAPYSDVDVLFLHAGRRAHQVSAFLELVLHLLWDIGLTVGHSFRSIAECIAMAKKDLHSRNALAEARLITGNAHLFRRLTRRLDETVLRNGRAVDAFIEAMCAERELRYARFGRAVCVQEPNVKESAGGLRDVHTVLWIGRALFGCRTLEDLRAEALISGAEYAAIDRAYNFVARVRNEAHFCTGRRTDLLTLDLQPTLAAHLGYESKRGLLASERFMREYYERAHDLHQFCERFLARTIGSKDNGRRWGFPVRKSKERSGQLRREGNRLTLDESAPLFRREPHELLNVFSRAQLEDLELSDELKQAIRAHLSLVTRSFRAAPESGRLFLDILGRRGRVGRALRLMHETGFLGRYLPEFARITFLVQHDFYHRYTIDEHTLKAIEALDEIAHRRESRLIPFQKIFAEVRDPAVLYLGLLLHDIGKGRSGSHVPRSARLAERVCERLRLESGRTAQVVFLVRHHLLMSHLSQRRDLTEDALIEDFARQVETLDHLNMLLLLTYADTFAVGPGVWNEWKEALLWELYARARARLTGGRPMRGRHAHRAVLKDQINRALPIKFLPSEIERHLAMMPDRYLRATRPQGIARHLLLVKRLDAQPLAIDWRTQERESCTELTLCTRDRVGLFALIAGTLTAQGLNILSADLYTREDDIVIDTFKVCEVSGHRPVRSEWQSKVERHLRDALIGRFDVAAAVQTWRAKVAHRRRRAAHRPAPIVVRFDSTASATSTVIEVKAEDEPGLAYTIASTLTALGLNITFAKVATEKNLAVDVFYVTDARGEKLAADTMAEVERALLEALDGEVKNRIDEEA